LHNSTFSFAARHGKPIITTSGVNTDDEFCEDENAVLVKPGDADLLAEAIVRVLEDPALRERIAAGALSLANSVYSWNRTIGQLQSLWVKPGKQSG
jgi:glycogen(starch) synthase